MKKQQITIVQTIATLKEYFEMTKNNQLPLVISINADLALALEELTTNEDEDKVIRNLKLSTVEIISILYNIHYCNKKKTYLFLNSYQLRNLIEKNIIYINDFIDYNNNLKYVDYIYPSCSVDSGGGIVFRGTPRLFQKKKDHYKLIKENVHVNIGGKSGTVTMFTSLPYNADSKEIWKLCYETVNIFEKKLEKKS